MGQCVNLWVSKALVVDGFWEPTKWPKPLYIPSELPSIIIYPALKSSQQCQKCVFLVVPIACFSLFL